MFSGEYIGRVLTMKIMHTIVRMKSARDTAGGIDRIGTPCMLGAARTER